MQEQIRVKSQDACFLVLPKGQAGKIKRWGFWCKVRFHIFR